MRSMNRSDIEAASARYHSEYLRITKRNGRNVLISLFVCAALILAWRYCTLGALEDPRRGATDPVAIAAVFIWVLAVAPLLSCREMRALRQYDLACPHCGRKWRALLLRNILAAGSCPYCRAHLPATADDSDRRSSAPEPVARYGVRTLLAYSSIALVLAVLGWSGLAWESMRWITAYALVTVMVLAPAFLALTLLDIWKDGWSWGSSLALLFSGLATALLATAFYHVLYARYAA